MNRGLFDIPFEDDEGERPSPSEGPRSDSVDAPAVTESSPTEETPRRGAPLRSSPARRTLTVTELTLRVRDLLEEQLGEVWVEGELSNCRVWNTGHFFFTLKDDATQIKCVIFRSAVRYLRFKPADGLRVVARGRISVYEPKGEYQIVCEHLEPQGLGALQLAYDQLKKRLHDEGLFDSARKRPLPSLPRKIGVVTSLDGAAIRDIIKVLGRRYRNLQLVIRPVRVQGDGASIEIARGIKAIGRVPGVDVVIVGRGGGSIEDLWAFNEEIVARAIAQAPVPVIAAVGHETDVTIADFVADVRAPTPSAAAEIVVKAKDEFCNRINRLEDRLGALVRARVQRLGRRVDGLRARPALAGFPARVALRGRHAAELSHALTRAIASRAAVHDRRLQFLRRQLDTLDLGRRLAAIRTRLVTSDGRLTTTIGRRRHRAETQLRDSAARLESLSPLAVLGRGYAVCWNADRTAIIRDASAASAGDRVRVTLHNGELACDVRSTEET
jgi:exodeoxyribonuclease VII large subunit